MTKKPTAAGARRTPGLADQLSALLSAEELPADVHDPLAESLHDLAGQARVTLLTPEVLRVALPIILGRLSAADSAAGQVATAPPPPAEAGGYRLITRERAGQLAYFISSNLASEEARRALVELLEGLMAAHFAGSDLEVLVTAATWRVYELTEHFGRAFAEYRGREPFDLEGFQRRQRGGSR